MGKNKSAFLKEENLLTLLSQNNFIIPEIQREYVWGENEKVIKKFLSDLKNKIGIPCETCNLPTSVEKINIGFLYSYKPDYVKIEHERFLDENLIDGQQRFTTLFLLLFFCSIKENRKQDFLSLIRFEEKVRMSLDFRVRDLTKKFLLELVEKVNNLMQFENINQQTWFLKDYKDDVSIKAMQKALGYIQDEFSDNTKYYNHLINYVVFWHFKTEVTSQGEELYITMNARGEELAENEVAKAALMVGDAELTKWGKKWEDWQQFFWKHRNKNNNNPSADKGFNGFLKCIAGLEFYLENKKGTKVEQDIQKLLTLEKVELYFESLKFLIEGKDSFAIQYTYSKWIDKAMSEIWKIFNDSNTDWFADYKDKNKAIERNRMIFLWSWMYYINNLKKEIDINELYRVLRFFFIRYNNFNRSVSTLKKTIDLILVNGIWDTSDNEMGNETDTIEDETDINFRTKEETIKNFYLKNKLDVAELLEIEEIIWQIEDHPLNLDSRNIGNINITHLIDLTNTTTLQDLQTLKDCFDGLFPNGTTKGSSVLKTILLHYGDFYESIPTGYYDRFDFSGAKKTDRQKDWRRNIRKMEFKIFLKDHIGKSTEEHLEELKANFVNKNKNQIKESYIALPADLSLRNKLIYYSLLLSPEDLWQEGEKIAIRYDVESSRLFKDENLKIHNSKGDFRGTRGNTDLWSEVIKTISNPLEKIKNRINDKLTS